MTELLKPADTTTSVHALITNRWSPRAFAETLVPTTALLAILEAGRWAASSNNGQPWRWVVAMREDAPAHIAAVHCFAPRNQRWAKAAPVLIFCCARKTFEANGTTNAHAWYDTGAASAQMTLEAESRSLRVHQAAGIDRDKVRATYAVPDDFEICTALAIGYQGDADALPEELPARERESRTRKPLDQLAFTHAFGTPINLR